MLERLGPDAGAVLITDPLNVRYLTGFTGSNAQLLLDAKPVFYTDGRYDEQSASQVPDLERVIYSGSKKFADILKTTLGDRAISEVVVEGAHMSLAEADRLREALDGVVLVPRKDVVEAERMRKDADEIEAIRTAQHIAESALSGVLERWRGGTEIDLALEIEWAMRTGGAEAVSFDIIVASGAHSALPHATPRDVAVDLDGVLLIDMGAKAGGYCSDMTRTYLGPKAPRELVTAHNAVRAALGAACEAVRPGAKGGDVDKAARDRLDAEGLAHTFVHSTGHGVGLDIHEAPSLAIGADEELEPGMAVTVEPGVYLPGVGGIRIEDLLIVTDDGADNLTTLDRGHGVPRPGG
ncbi:MAG TPA: Xaa-Pro peptidase family protein [Actinomycetota bacterium]|nr:Xaa-Pro peptidase family protein [Actinomycetota bacterium]